MTERDLIERLDAEANQHGPPTSDLLRAARDEIERLRAALKPFAEVGEKFAPYCAPTGAWPPDASARFMNLEPLKVSDFVAAYRTFEAGTHEQ